jgi:death on curing protein
MRFLKIDEILYFHEQEIKQSGGAHGIRDLNSLESAIFAPKAVFEGEFLMDIFEMAATYVNSICFNHPFLDGNKRTATVSALSFLYLNGYECDETYEEELADLILDLVIKKIDKNKTAEYFRSHSRAIF